MDRAAMQRTCEERLRSVRELAECIESVVDAGMALMQAFAAGGKLLLAGNGGSFADCLHLSAELLKSFEVARPLSAGQKEALAGLPFGDRLGRDLEQGLPAVVLGNNGSLATAVTNDKSDGRLVLAQECLALGRAGDVLLGISTSGEAENVLMAMSAAKVQGMRTITLTGTPGGAMAAAADIAIRAPGASTAAVQESHVRIYHALCAAIEIQLFGKRSAP